MSITQIPTRQIGDVITCTDVNTLMSNDNDLQSQLSSLKNTVDNNLFSLIVLQNDVVNNNAVANTLMDTGLQFEVTAGETYAFYVCCIYDAAATTTGARFVLSGAQTPTFVGYMGTTSLTTTTQTITYANAFNLPSACNASSAYTTNNIATIEGIIRAAANDTIKVRFASEVASSAITCKAGSYMTVRRVL